MERLEYISPGGRIDPAVAFQGNPNVPAGRVLPLGVIDLENTQQICIGGVIREIASFEDIAKREPPDFNLGGDYFKAHNYLSILMGNLGYNKRPADMGWLDQGIPVENVPKTIPLDFSPTRNALRIKPDRMLLADLLNVIYFWGRGRIEVGYVLDQEKSFKLPPEDQIKYCFQNKIEVKLSCAISVEKVHWCISDIRNRRLHNLCPHINKEYFYNCIRNFDGYAKQIYVNHPHSVFVSAIVDPTILLTIIRNSEIQAAKIVNRKYMNYKALRPDYETVLKFVEIFSEKIEHLHNIFKKYGAAGFVDLVREEYVGDRRVNVTMNAEVSNMKPDPQDRLGEFVTVEEKRQFIKETELDDGKIKTIAKFLDMESLPDYLLKTVSVKDERGNTVSQYDECYYDTMRRLYNIFEQMQIYYPSYVDSSNKWIMSKPFFRSADAFALYSQVHKLFLIAFPDITWKVCDSTEAIKCYKDRYDDDILLDADELGDSFESGAAKDHVFQDEIPKGEEGRYANPSVNSDLEIVVSDGKEDFVFGVDELPPPFVEELLTKAKANGLNIDRAAHVLSKKYRVTRS